MSRSLPPRPSLRHLQKEAKDLLKSHRRGESRACAALRLIPRFAQASDSEILSARVALADVQFALALDYGFKTWAEMRRVVEAQPGPAASPAASSPTLIGQVFDRETGAPLSGVSVRAWSRGQAKASTQTDTDGRFRLEAPSNDYHVWIDVLTEGYAGEMVLLDISPGKTLERTFRLGREAIIIGRVSDEGGKSVADVDVTAHSQIGTETSAPGTKAKTDSEGRYAIRHVPRGQVSYVEAVRAGYIMGWATIEVPLDAQTLTHDFVMKPGPTVSGTVVDEAGRPLEGVVLRVDWTGTPEVSSDVNGRFAFAGLPYGLDHPHNVTAAKDGYATTVRSVGRGYENASNVVITMKPEMTIRGVVVDEAGAPIAHAVVGTHTEGNAPSSSTMAGSDGTFVLDKLVEGRYQLIVGMLSTHQSFADIPAGATGVRLVVRRSACFIGRVVDATTSAPIPVFRVLGDFSRMLLPHPATMIHNHDGKDFRDARGSFELGPPAERNQIQRLIVVAPGYCVGEVDGVKPGQPVEVRLRKATPIVVQVVDRDSGIGIDGALVRFQYWRAAQPLNWAKDPDTNPGAFLPSLDNRRLGGGRYEFLGVGNGPWLLKVVAAGYLPQILKFPDGPESARIEVACVRKGGADIAGVVIDEAANPIEGATVQAGSWSRVAVTTDQEGRFVLDNLVTPVRSEHIELCVSKEGYAAARPSVDPRNRDEATHLHITLKPERTISGMLVDETGAPVPNAVVGANMVSDDPQNTSTDAGGDFVLRCFTEGTYRLQMWRDGYPVQRSPAIEAGSMNVRLVLRKGAPLAGAVIDADTDSPIASFDAYLTEHDSGSPTPLISNWGRAFEDPDGNFSFPGTFHPDHNFRLIVRAPGYLQADMGHVKPGRPLEIRLRKAVPLAVRVADADTGRPISGAQVRFHYWIGRGEIDPKRDPAMDDLFLTPLEASDLGEGRYEALGVGSGQWMLRVRAPGFAPHTRILAGDPGAEEIRVLLARRL